MDQHNGAAEASTTSTHQDDVEPTARRRGCSLFCFPTFRLASVDGNLSNDASVCVPEARRLNLLPASARPDMVQSLKLGLNPMAPVITSVYEFEEVLGRGAFGEVQRGRHIESGRNYAIKKIESSKLRLNALRAEIRILKQCRHPNIVALREVYATEAYIYLVMEMASGGALMEKIVRDGQLSEQLAAKATQQIAKALAFMHKAGVVHRDMKPENLLLADETSFIIKICDFGLSKICDTSNDARKGGSGCNAPAAALQLDDRELVMKSRVGTQWYASPELLMERATYDQSIDVRGSRRPRSLAACLSRPSLAACNPPPLALPRPLAH